jgi:hypothetical protein
MQAEETAISYVDFENKHGSKPRIFNSPGFLFQMFDVTLLLNLTTAESYSRFYKGQTL